MKAFPKGAGDDDFVIISGKAHRWSKHRGMFVTDGVHVPEMPDKHPVITLFTELTAGGVLTDFMGNKWQLQPYAERAAAPVITVTDLTQTEYPYTTYPLMEGKRWAVAQISIEAGEPDCELEYKIIKDGDEPFAWNAFDAPFVIRQKGDYQIMARAKKTGAAESTIVYSTEFTIKPCAYEIGYRPLVIKSFTYPVAAAVVESGDITIAPALSYGQPVYERYTDGTAKDAGERTEGATVSFAFRGGGTTTTYAEIDASTGVITVDPNTSQQGRALGYAVVTVLLDEETATQETAFAQAGRTKAANVITWDTVPASSIIEGDDVTFAAHALEGTVTFEDGEGSAISSPLENVQNDITIVAKVAETTNYKAASDSKAVTVNAQELPFYWGMSNGNEYVPEQPSPYSSGTTLISELDEGGTFTSGDVKDYSGVSVPIACIYFAVPAGKTIRIDGAGAGGEVTSDFTPLRGVDGYDIYYQTGFIQEKFTITVS